MDHLSCRLDCRRTEHVAPPALQAFKVCLMLVLHSNRFCVGQLTPQILNLNFMSLDVLQPLGAFSACAVRTFPLLRQGSLQLQDRLMGRRQLLGL